jgi:hypothetical protein
LKPQSSTIKQTFDKFSSKKKYLLGDRIIKKLNISTNNIFSTCIFDVSTGQTVDHLINFWNFEIAYTAQAYVLE